MALLLVLLSVPHALLAQNYTVRGSVRSARTGEALIEVTVAEPALRTGTYTDAQGRFVLRLPAGRRTLRVSALNYATQFHRFDLQGDLELEFVLADSVGELGPVVIEADAVEEALNRPQLGLNRIDMAQARQLPAIFGEVDVLKILQFLPGIKVGVEGTAGFFVRGGSNDQNAVLLDGSLLYNPTHLGGLFGTFNSDVIEGLDVFKGSFPARYGGRLSSVIDVRTRAPQPDRWHVAGGLGLISSRVAVDVPLRRNQTGLLLAARRTYLDLFTRTLNAANASDPDYAPLPNYAFTDFHARTDWHLNATDRLTLTGFYGNDNIAFKDRIFNFDFGWSNSAASLKWERLTAGARTWSVQASFTQYDYRIRTALGAFSGNLRSRVRDGNLTLRHERPWGRGHRLQTGASLIGHQFFPSLLDARGDADDLRFQFRQVLRGGQGAVWLGDNWEINSRWTLENGLRVSGWLGQKSTYGGLEPRAAANFRATDWLSLKGGYSRCWQYQHLASSSTLSLPTDIWYPSTANLQPQRSDLISAAAVWGWKKLGLVTTVEGYAKWMRNVVELRPAALLFINPDLDRDLVQGLGTSRGVEFQVEKPKGKTSGWVAYTLSWTDRLFDGRDGFALLNEGRPFPFRYDRRHDLSVVLVQELWPRLSLSAAFVYRTGEAVSVPTGRTLLRDLEGINRIGLINNPATGESGVDLGQTVAIFEARNNFRMPAYHRLDLSLTWKFRPKRGESELVFSVYNAYNRANPFVLVFEEVVDENRVTIGLRARIVALFPALPAISWNFRF